PRPPHPGPISSWPKREGSQAATRQLGSNNRAAAWSHQTPLCSVRSASAFGATTIPLAWAEDRALLWEATRAPSQGPRPKGAARGRPLPFGIGTKALNPSSVASPNLFSTMLSVLPHVPAPASARHSAYVVRLRSMCQMIVASFRITATRAMLAPLLRLRRLNHSRSRASLRSTLMVTCASSHLAMLLPALVILPSRWLFSPLLRQPGVRPQ